MKLTNITHPDYRCTFGACPAVYRDRTPERYRCEISASCPAVHDDDSGNFVFIGEKLDPLPEELAGKVGATEAAVNLSADLLLSSLGVSELVEAAEDAMPALVVAMQDARKRGAFDLATDLDRRWAALRDALSRMKGEQ